MNDCYLCTILKEKKYIRWESELWYSVFDTCPVSPGHILLAPKRHVADFLMLTEPEFIEIRNAVKNTISIIESTDLVNLYKSFIKDPESVQSVWFCKKALTHKKINSKPDGYNHGFNDGRAAGRTVEHFHWHIIPRYKGDINNSTGGIRFVIPEMGDYLKGRG